MYECNSSLPDNMCAQMVMNAYDQKVVQVKPCEKEGDTCDYLDARFNQPSYCKPYVPNEILLSLPGEPCTNHETCMSK